LHWLTESRGRAPIVAWSWIRVVTFALFVNASLAEWSYAIALCTVRDLQYLFAVGETDPCLLDLADITADSRSLSLRLLRLLRLLLLLLLQLRQLVPWRLNRGRQHRRRLLNRLRLRRWWLWW
jgi:hypothetical protein